MFFLTHRERKVLIAITVLILAGTLSRFLRSSKVEAVSKFTPLEASPDVSGVPRSGPLMGPEFAVQKSSSLININNASVQELCEIKGVGRVTAQRIIEHRDKFGRFKIAEDLKKVKGIGESKAKAIAGQVCFE